LISNPVRVAAGFDDVLSGEALNPKQFFKRQEHYLFGLMADDAHNYPTT
jgi:hypothetical protein